MTPFAIVSAICLALVACDAPQETKVHKAAGREFQNIEWDGHVFIRSGASPNYDSLVHHPDCPCQKKSNPEP